MVVLNKFSIESIRTHWPKLLENPGKTTDLINQIRREAPKTEVKAAILRCAGQVVRELRDNTDYCLSSKQINSAVTMARQLFAEAGKDPQKNMQIRKNIARAARMAGKKMPALQV